MRVIFTGSQTWDEPDPIARVLGMYTTFAFQTGRRLVAVHGAHWQGGDKIVNKWVRQHERKGWPVSQERHPANWDADCIPGRCFHGPRRIKNGRSTCQAAGQYRNEHMAALGAQACEAFCRDGSHGASRMAALARKAGIPTEVTSWEDRLTVRDDIARHPGQPGMAMIQALHTLPH
jgi:hypothetical protein